MAGHVQITATSLLPALALVVAALGGAVAYVELHRRDVERRLTEVDNNPFAHLAALLFELFHDLGDLARGRDPGRHGERAFVAFVSLVILATTPILAAGVAEPSQLAQHAMAFTLGTMVWSVVIEVPGQRTRTPRLILIVLALDIAVTVLAMSGVIQASEVSAFISEVAAVAVVHLVSALLSVVRLAFDPRRRF